MTGKVSVDIRAFQVQHTSNGAYGPDALALIERNDLLVEEKYDCSLYVAKFFGSNVQFTSRRESKKTGLPCDKTANLPHLNRCPVSLNGTVLLGEVLSPTREFHHVSGTMNSLPAKAIASQKERGWLQYYVFDCLWYKGKEVRCQPLVARRALAEKVVWLWGAFQASRSPTDRSCDCECPVACIHISPALFGTYEECFRKVVERGGEGLMLKEPDAPYGEGVFKVKKATDVSAFVSGYTEGKGKYKGQIGAILFSVLRRPYNIDVVEKVNTSYLNEGDAPTLVIEIGKCSGMDDAMRLQISKNQKVHLGKVIDVCCEPPDKPSAWTGQRLRHPRFIRFRDDLSPLQCTVSKVRSDFMKLTKGGK